MENRGGAERDFMNKQAAICFGKMMKLAMNRCRNYILDQTNIFPASRSDKANAFALAGFKVIAAIIAISKEELEIRSRSRANATGKSIPKTAIFELMVNFYLPEECEKYRKVFTDSIYVDSTQQKTKETAKLCRAVARKNGCTPHAKQSAIVLSEYLNETYDGMILSTELPEMTDDVEQAINYSNLSRDSTKSKNDSAYDSSVDKKQELQHKNIDMPPPQLKPVATNASISVKKSEAEKRRGQPPVRPPSFAKHLPNIENLHKIAEERAKEEPKKRKKKKKWITVDEIKRSPSPKDSLDERLDQFRDTEKSVSQPKHEQSKLIPNPDEIQPPSLNIDFAKLAQSIAMVQQPQASSGAQLEQEDDSDANLFTGVLKDAWKLEDEQNEENQPEKTMENLRASRPGPIENEMQHHPPAQKPNFPDPNISLDEGSFKIKNFNRPQFPHQPNLIMISSKIIQQKPF